jgi:hypothetical protein
VLHNNDLYRSHGNSNIGNRGDRYIVGPPTAITGSPAEMWTLRGSYGVQLNLLHGFEEPHHCVSELDRTAANPLCADSSLFSCFVVTDIPVMLTCYHRTPGI